MTATYVINILDYSGALKSALFDFQTLSIVDSRNDVGSWSITSQTKDPAPFEAGDSICVLRDGVNIYSGVMTELTEEYHKKSNSWGWKASGCNFSEFLKWKYIYPAVTSDSGGGMTSRYCAYANNTPSYIIADLIEKNVVYNNGYTRTPTGVYMVNGTSRRIPFGYQERAIDYVSYRFDSVFDTVMGLASDSDFTILPVFSSQYSQVIYVISANFDKSNTVVFSSELDQIDVFKRVIKAPDATHIIESYNGDTSSIYKYYSAEGIGSATGWENGGQSRELFVEPKEEDFNGTFTKAKLTDICQTEAKSRTKETEGYEITLNIENCPFTYGYKLNGMNLISDYVIGDTIGIIFQGEKFTARLNGMEYNVSYGQESIKPTIGIRMRGKFNRILANLANLSQSVNKKQNSQR